MSIHPLALCVLLLACSCRFIVDPDRFRDDDAGNGIPDAMVNDAPPALECGEWQPKYLDIDLSDIPPNPEIIVLTLDDYSLDANGGIVSSGGQQVATFTPMMQRNGEMAWVLWVESLTVEDDAGLRTGLFEPSLPLIVAARSRIIVKSPVEMGSKRVDQILGPGANLPEACGDGAGLSGQGAVTAGAGGGGGGFGGAGAPGGDIDTDTVGGAGGQGRSDVPDGVRGGCPGGTGAPGDSTATPGGFGGGAIHLVACESIEVANIIDVGGAGGTGGAGNGAGGGGGGSGGYIGLEASTIWLNNATITANGGGGGGGSQAGAAGEPGSDGLAGEGFAPGGAAVISGGDGGTRDTPATAGHMGSSVGGGGGGGGGTGYIYIRGGLELPVDTIISPAPVVEPLQ